MGVVVSFFLFFFLLILVGNWTWPALARQTNKQTCV